MSDSIDNGEYRFWKAFEKEHGYTFKEYLKTFKEEHGCTLEEYLKKEPMTSKEAVARIKDHLEIHRYHERNAVKIFEAFYIAIKALEQQSFITFDDITLYKCDPAKNISCKKSGCYVNGGPCKLTRHEEYREEYMEVSRNEL